MDEFFKDQPNASGDAIFCSRHKLPSPQKALFIKD